MKKILLSIFLCLPFLLSAQPYTIKHLSIREGLSNNHVVSIAQDKRGSLWFATEEGLNKFDGIRFLTYYKEETTGKQSITGNELNCLLDDPVDSILWIGTQRAGINAYNYANDSFITYRHNENNPKSLVTDDITKIIAASEVTYGFAPIGKAWTILTSKPGNSPITIPKPYRVLQATISGLP